MAIKAECGQVEPFWVHLGYVKWTNSPEREKLWTIEYRQCRAEATRLVKDGFTCYLCERHRS